MLNYDLVEPDAHRATGSNRIHRLGQERDMFRFQSRLRATPSKAYILDLLANKIKMFRLVVGEARFGARKRGDRGHVRTPQDMACALPMTLSAQKHRMDEFSATIDDARKRFAQIKEAEVVVSRLFE